MCGLLADIISNDESFVEKREKHACLAASLVIPGIRAAEESMLFLIVLAR